MKTDSDLSPVSGPKAAVSNLALVGDEFESALDYVASLGAEGIEIAPTVLWPGWGRSPSAAREAREKVEARSLGVASLQSILYGRSDLNLFGTADVRARLEAHLMDVGELAVELEAPIIVFGSPENRRRDGLGLDEAIDTAASFFRRIGERLSRLGVVLTMEPNPSQYGADFLTDLPSAASFVRLVGSSGIRLQLDTSEIILNGLDPAEEIPPNLDIIGHVHVSEPHLQGFDPPSIVHEGVAEALDGRWFKWVSLEMRRPAEGLGSVDTAFRFMRRTYFGVVRTWIRVGRFRNIERKCSVTE